MKFKTQSIFLIFLLIFFVACEKKDDKKSESAQNISKYSLKTIDDTTINISLENNKIIVENSNDKIVLINFFATWCPPCKVEIPNLVKLQDMYHNDIIVIGLLLEDFKTNEEIREFMNSLGANYTVTNSNEAFDLAKDLGGLKSIPALFIIDKDGEVFKKITGLVPTEMLDTNIKKLLER